MDLIEQLFRSDLRMWTGLITTLLILNVVIAIISFKKKSLPKGIQKHFGKTWILLNIVIIALQIFTTAKRYQERLIPPQEMPESTFETDVGKKREAVYQDTTK